MKNFSFYFENIPSNNSEIENFLIKHWESSFIVSRGKKVDAAKLPRIIARDKNKKLLGLVTFQIDKNNKTCEIVSIDAVKKGIILFFAIPSKNVEIPIEEFWRCEITATSSYGAAPSDLEESLLLIKERKVNVSSMITHMLPLKDIQKAFNIALDAKQSLKVILKPHQS